MPCPTTVPRTVRKDNVGASSAPATHRPALRWRNDCRSHPDTTARPRATAVPRCCPRPLAAARAERQHAAAHLVELQRLEQRLEVALAKTLIALALNDFEKAWADRVLGENLQQQTLALRRRAVDQNAPLAQARQ